MVKKEDDVAVDDDDNALRNNVSQTRVTIRLCTEELFLRTLSI